MRLKIGASGRSSVSASHPTGPEETRPISGASNVLAEALWDKLVRFEPEIARIEMRFVRVTETFSTYKSAKAPSSDNKSSR